MGMKASSADIQRALADIAVLQKKLEEEKATQAAEVERLLEAAQRKQDAALQAQEMRHSTAMAAALQGATTAYGEMASQSTQQFGAIATMLGGAVTGSANVTADAVRDIGKGIQDCLSAGNSIKMEKNLLLARAVTALEGTTAALTAAENARALREERESQLRALQLENAAKERAQDIALITQHNRESLAIMNQTLQVVSFLCICPHLSSLIAGNYFGIYSQF
jgi:cephalosporin hydroxylase